MYITISNPGFLGVIVLSIPETLFIIIAQMTAFFQTGTFLTNSDFVIRINLIRAAIEFVSFVYSYIETFTRGGSPPKKQMVRILCCAAYCRLRPDDLVLVSQIRTLFQQIGAPSWVTAFSFLIPTGPIEVRGLFSLRVQSVAETTIRTNYIPRLTNDLLAVKRYYQVNTTSLPLTIDPTARPSKKVDVTVFELRVTPVTAIGNVLASRVACYPSFDGYRHGLSWLFFLLFIPFICDLNGNNTVTVERDFRMFTNCNFFGVISIQTFRLLLRQILFWYFDGHFLVSERIESRPGPTRDPRTGTTVTPPGAGRKTRPSSGSASAMTVPPPPGGTSVLDSPTISSTPSSLIPTGEQALARFAEQLMTITREFVNSANMVNARSNR